jgi:neutral ceramidase
MGPHDAVPGVAMEKGDGRMNCLVCGAARARITPSADLIPNLRGLGDALFGGVLDDIFVRAIALGHAGNRALLVAFDLDKAPHPAENLAKISGRTGIPEENIFFFSIHTHTAPVTGYRPEEPVNDVQRKPPEVQEASARYEQQVSDATLKVVDEAVGDMRPARMGYAYEKSYINVNRSQDYEYTDEKGELHSECCLGVNFAAPVDRTLFVMKFEAMDGLPMAFFMNYPVHNCVMIGNKCCGGKMGISGDIGGTVSRFLEERFAGSTAIWSSGAAGDVNPLMMNEIDYPDPSTGRMVQGKMSGGEASLLMTMATRHFADVMKAIRKIVCTSEAAPIIGMVDWSFIPGRNVVVRDDGTTEIAVGDGVDPYEIRLHLVKLGNVALYGFSGELYSSLGRRIKEISPMENTILINHDASLMARSGYIFDDETLARDTSNRLPGHGNSHMLPGYVLESLEKHTLEMFEKLGNNHREKLL